MKMILTGLFVFLVVVILMAQPRVVKINDEVISSGFILPATLAFPTKFPTNKFDTELAVSEFGLRGVAGCKVLAKYSIGPNSARVIIKTKELQCSTDDGTSSASMSGVFVSSGGYVGAPIQCSDYECESAISSGFIVLDEPMVLDTFNVKAYFGDFDFSVKKRTAF